MNNKIDMNNMEQLMQLANQQQPQQIRGNEKNIGYCELLSLVLVTMKCLGFISCNWLVPFLPVLVPFILYIFIVFYGFIKNKFLKQ